MPFEGFFAPVEEAERRMTLDQYLIPNREACFVVRMTSSRMSGAGILPGDLVIVERGRVPIIGDLVAAQVDDQWVIRRFERRNRQFVLVDASIHRRLLNVTEEIRLTGVVIGVVRKIKSDRAEE